MINIIVIITQWNGILKEKYFDFCSCVLDLLFFDLMFTLLNKSKFMTLSNQIRFNLASKVYYYLSFIRTQH